MLPILLNITVVNNYTNPTTLVGIKNAENFCKYFLSMLNKTIDK